MILYYRLLLVIVLILYTGSLLSQSQANDNKFISVKDTVKISEVEISIKNIIRTGDKESFYPTRSQRSHSHDIYSLLKNLMFSQLNIDPLEKTVKSVRGGVLLCINGRKCLADEIQSLNPEDIARVDYYSKRNNPDHPEATEVLDFITIQRSSGGALNFNATQHLNKNVSDYSFTNHNYKQNSEFSFGLVQNSKNYNGAYKNVEESFQFPNYSIVRLAQGQPALQSNSKWAGFANYSYNNDNKTKASLSIEYLNSKSEDKVKSENTYNIDTIASSSVNSVTQSNTKAIFLTSNISQQLKNGQLLTFDLRASKSKNYYSRDYTEGIIGNGMQALSSTANEQFQTLRGQLSYKKTFNDKSAFLANLFSYQSMTDISYRNDFTADESLRAGQSIIFFAYSKKLGKLSLYGKIGFSDTYFHQSDSISKTYFALLPTFSADYKINDHSSLEFSEFMYNNVPSLSWQSNVQQSIDFMQVNRGNPNVKQLNALENYFAYNLKLPKVDFTAYIWNSNFFNNTQFDVFNEGNLFVHTYVTNGRFHIVVPTIVSTIHFLDDRLTTKLTCSWSKYWLTGERANELSQWAFNGQINYTQNNIMLSLEYNTPERTLTNGGRIISTSVLYDLNLGYTFKGANLSIGIRNPCSKGDIIYEYRTKDYSSKETRILKKMGDHIVFAKLSYHFSYGKKHNFQEKNVTSSTSSGILKGEF
ncbi:MAG TPA: hypothetical protein VFP20_07095 [Bacteroidales bacterium]|nr:hypothetical protein [Bacteroidales bacterium]